MLGRSAQPRRPLRSARGFSVAELVVAAAIVAILAAAAVPMMTASSETKLDAAGAEVGNALRFAFAESRRTGGYVLVDAGTRPGHVLLLNSDATAARGADVVDPLTKRTMDIDVTGSSFSAGVRVNAKFMTASGAYTQLLVGPGPLFSVAESSVVMGPLQPASGIDLTLGSRTVTVGFDSVTGRVSLP
jgi:prepilin-type N-terminal cleavage/methylation domain-containing protein